MSSSEGRVCTRVYVCIYIYIYVTYAHVKHLGKQ